MIVQRTGRTMAELSSSEAVRVWQRLRARFGDPELVTRDGRRRRAKLGGEPYSPGRDPHGLGAVFDDLAGAQGWTAALAQGSILAAWPKVVGPENAQHSTPESVIDGTLFVRCATTGWAQQLRFLRGQLLARIQDEFPDAGVTQITVRGPDAPSVARGRWRVQGRGPRDTWG